MFDHPPADTSTSLRSAAVALRKRTQRPRAAAAPARTHAPGSLTPRDEKILLMLAMQTQQINDRLTRLEDRFEANLRDTMSQPDQQDLLELRLHSARVAAELSRVAIELRAEINELAQTRGEVIDLTALDDLGLTDRDDSPAHPSAGGLAYRRVDDLVADAREPVLRMRPRRTSGWKPVRSTNPPDS